MEGVLSQIDADCDDFGVRGMCSCCREEASKLRSVGVVHAIDLWLIGMALRSTSPDPESRRKMRLSKPSTVASEPSA